MSLRLSSGPDGRDVLLVQGDFERSGSRHIRQVGYRDTELGSEVVKHGEGGVPFGTLKIPVVALRDRLDLLVSEACLPTRPPQISSNPLEKLVRVHASDSNYRNYLSRLLSFRYCARHDF